MCRISDIEFSKLRISRAYIKLLCIPDGVEKIVSLARIGNYEVRMFESSQTGSDAVQLFSMELFDHDAQSPVDSCICYSLDAGSGCLPGFHFAMKLFEGLGKDQTARLNESFPFIDG